MIIKRDILKEHPFLRAMVPEHRSVIAQGAEDKVFREGEILCREGQPANRLYLVNSGKVALETHVPGRGDVLVASLGPGQVIGWSWLVAPFVWQFQVRALEPTDATVLNGGHLLVACEQNHYLGYELMRDIGKVILEVLLAAHERWLQTGHRPKMNSPDNPTVSPPEPAQAIGTRISRHAFFHGMAEPYLKILEDLAQPIEFELGQRIFETGAPATGLFVLERGRIILEAVRADGPVPVQAFGPGDAVGWSSFCEPYRWHFDGRAIEPVATLFFGAAELREHCARDYDLGYELTKRTTRIMLQRLQAIRNRMWDAYR